MFRSSLTPLFASLLALCTFIGCDSPKSSLGELPVETSGTETTDATDATATADESGSFPETGEIASDIGAPCTLAGVPESHLLELGNAECNSGMCLYGDVEPPNPSQTCATAEDCDTDNAICDETGHCRLDPAHVAARSMCTAGCVDDSDCVGVEGTACEGGFICVPVTELGSTCCQPMCACSDDYPEWHAMPLEQGCADGTSYCCESNPQNCGG